MTSAPNRTRIRISRRAFVGASLAALGCSRRHETPASEPARLFSPSALSASGSRQAETTPATRTISWRFEESSVTGGDVVVLVPQPAIAKRYPVLVALHGQGEALKPSHEGALGWARDYALIHAIERVSKPPLTPEDLEGFVDPARLAELNRELRVHPYGGLVIVCPHMRDIDPNGPHGSAEVRDFAQFVIGDVLPRVRRELPCSIRREGTGIDGISLGGAAALRIGLTHPDVFGAVGGLQPAIHTAQIAGLTELARAARAKAPQLQLRLLTSDHDYFRDAIRDLSAAWRAAGVDHDFVDVPGPHDYVFNRGPGSIELLTWHNRVLATDA